MLFTHAIIDPALLKVVTPIGIVGGGNTEIVGRSYLFPKDETVGMRIPIVAPTSLAVVGATHYTPAGAPSGYLPDWSLRLDAGCGVAIELYHIKDVAASIKAVADTTIGSSSAYQFLPKRVPLAAGETIGWYVKGLNSIAWDFIVNRGDVTNHFANQARYTALNSNLLHVVCPYDLYGPDQRAAYLSLVGSVGGMPVPGAGCGSVERDVVGTPAGQWFTSATTPAAWQFSKNGYYGDPLPIALGADSTLHIGHIGPTNDIRIFRSNSSWKDPASITTSWCYQISGGGPPAGWIWLRMTTSAQMHVAFEPTGTCPSAFPTSGFQQYFR